MYRAYLVALAVALLTGVAAQGADSAVQLPTDPRLWINSPPVSLESLRGKGVVLYFFEEDCPNCAKKWPELVQLQKQNADKPIVFIGISSGTDRSAMEQYVHTNGVAWPVVLDPTRTLEKSAGVGEISLQNIGQYRYISADGALRQGDWQDVPGTAAKALEGAAWRVEPAAIPPALKSAWMAVELGNFAQASAMIKKATADKKPEIKAAGEKLQAAAEEALTKEIDAAKKNVTADKWTTFKTFRGIAERFKGYTLPEDFKKEGSALFNDEEVKKQLAALEDLEALKKGLSSKSPAVYRKTLDKLDKVIADHPGTEAAAVAAEIKQSAQR